MPWGEHTLDPIPHDPPGYRAEREATGKATSQSAMLLLKPAIDSRPSGRRSNDAGRDGNDLQTRGLQRGGFIVGGGIDPDYIQLVGATGGRNDNHYEALDKRRRRRRKGTQESTDDCAAKI